MAVKVTRKGQVTIPKAIRDHLGIKAGSKIDFKLGKDGRVLLHRADERAVRPKDFERMRGTATSGLTTDEIMALTREWRNYP